MAVLPATKRITRADLGEDVPEWVDNLLSPLNSFIEQIYTAFNKNISIPENVASQIVQLDINTNSDYSTGNFPSTVFKRTLAKKANLLIIGQVRDLSNNEFIFTTGGYPSWEDNNGTISIYYIPGLSDSKKYRVNLLVL